MLHLQLQQPELRGFRFLQFLSLVLFMLFIAVPQRISFVPSWYQFFLDKLNIGIPLFFFAAGFLWIVGHGNSSHIKASLVIVKKVKLLLLPYFFLGSIAFFIAAYFRFSSFYPIDYSILGFFASFFFPFRNPIPFFWILPSLFLIYSLACFTLRGSYGDRRLLIYYALSVLLFFILKYIPFKQEHDPLALISLFKYLHFFILGVLVGRFIELVKSRRFFLIVLLLFHFFLFIKMLLPVPIVLLTFLNWAYYSSLLLLIYLTSMKIGPKLVRNNLFYWLAFFSYPIILFSWFVLSFVQHFLFCCYLCSPLVKSLAILVSFAAGLLIPFIIAFILHKILPERFRPLFGF